MNPEPISEDDRIGQLVTGVVQRQDGDDLIVSLGEVEAYLPKEERVRGETFAPGDRIRAIVVGVHKDGPHVRIIVSRAHEDLVRRLFELSVPEIADGTVEIKRVARDPGYRTKVALISRDPKIDAIVACVGARGSRVKAVADELRGERIDIIRWSEYIEALMQRCLKPATIEFDDIHADSNARTVVVILSEEQRALAAGPGGRNVRLASRLCGWDIRLESR